MSGRSVRVIGVLLCLHPVLRGELAAGQAQADAGSRTVTALRLQPEERINMDGRLDEGAWQRAQAATDFTQADPRNGAPATERTEVRFVFDRDRLYMGVHCFDSEPDRLLGNQMVRDGYLSGDDRFMWTLDPYFNQRTGYFFEINPSGAMGDGLLVPAQGGGGGGLGFGASQNRGWDGIWLARVRRHEQGWSAEIEIPFRTLNFDPRAPAWGANFQRTVRRKNEESLWSGYGRNQGLFNLASAGHLVGITDASQGLGLDVKPYVIGNYIDEPGTGRAPILKGTGGVDFFYNLSPQLKANLTINTDFAQTEVDDRQVNLTRFPLFFPEKRDFFLEGSSSFDFSREPTGNFTAFFSRRIGLDERGRPQRIDHGVKMTGQAGPFDLGILQVRTAPQRDSVGEDFTVLRLKRRFLLQSYVGAIYTRRAERGSGVPARQTIGADFELGTTRFRGSQNLLFSGFYVRTPDGTERGNDAAYGLRLNYPNDLWNARMSYRVVQENYDAAAGFVERTNYRRWNPVVRFGPRPKNHPWIRQVSTEAWIEYLTDTSFRLIGRAFR
ncbi:MAG: carbohydrate binding family 9 domain-containing protein, partial [Acidobacteria bacterium]|nr:carbohydrate binding family 9 domain-containing protein [Acidobacteriota bacterium]